MTHETYKTSDPGYSKAYWEGHKAYHAKRPLSANPWRQWGLHDPDKNSLKDYLAWDHGWQDASIGQNYSRPE